MAKKEGFQLTKKCDHVAFIMDGNGRWAKQRGLARHFGHHEACKRIIEIFETFREFNIRVMSFYAFSTENWNRPQEEIDHLMDYLEEFFQKEIDYLDSVGTKIMISGDLSRIRPQTREVCLQAVERTKNNDSWVINVCLVDLMIRTSGEERLSNFMLYENAYAEFVFTSTKWPDFRHDNFVDCLKEFNARSRRYGGLKNE